jgi:hypothetical protein
VRRLPTPGLALAIFGICAVAMALAVLLALFATGEPFTADLVLFPIAYLAFAAVGALVVVRQPRNVIGWLALATGALGTIAGLADELARVAAFAGRDWAAWVATWLFPLSFVPALLLVLTFPTGRLASPRWRVVAAMIVVGGMLVASGSALLPTMPDHPDATNPFGIPSIEGIAVAVRGIGWFSLLGGAVLAGIGLVPRLRRASGIERAQLKWITYVATLHGLCWLVLALDLPGVAGQLAEDALFLTLALLPVAAGIAILRYRLFEIDVVIRRTLIYGAVVVVLGAVYVALILALQTLLTKVTGGGTLPVALSTLVIAVLFGPVRSRIRELVDRRFYRSRYDVARAHEALVDRMRDTADPDALIPVVTHAVVDAIQPSTVSLWVRQRPR